MSDAPKIIDAPDTIWLNYGDIERDCTHAECYREGDVTWCQEPVFDSDVKYVRADDATLARIAELEAEWRRECDDADKIMEKIGLTIEQARTDGGSLKVAFICNHIQETLDALAATQALQIDTFNKMVRLERENAELRRDAERLNHVERHGCWQVTHDEWRPRTDGTNIHDKVTVIEGWIAMDGANDDLIKPTLREAIDAAIAREKENERG